MLTEMEISAGNTAIPALDFTFMEPCESCGEYTYKDDLIKCGDDSTVCSKCREENYFQCYHCDEWYPDDDAHTFDSNKICGDCFEEHYIACTHCGDILEKETALSSDDGDWYCLHCYDEVYTDCESCGHEVHRADTYYDEERDQNVCRLCYHERQGETILHSHGSDLSVCFHDENHLPHYVKIEGRMYYGMELELESPVGNLGEVVEAIMDESEDDWYLEEDGSLREGQGIEVIAHARTFESWRTFWSVYDERVLRVASRKHCKAHDAGTCGIHIHTSLDAWEGDQLFRLFSLLYNPQNYDTILTISQRQPEDLEYWSSLKVSDIGICKDDVENKTSPFDSKYSALNITFSTLEFRLFNSNLRLDRVQKNMEFVHALYCYTGQVKRQATWKGFMSWVSRHKGTVPHLYTFLLERRILEEKKAEMQEAA
jgi:formylmethanofuran dehydrogenase subunit E